MEFKDTHHYFPSISAPNRLDEYANTFTPFYIEYITEDYRQANTIRLNITVDKYVYPYIMKRKHRFNFLSHMIHKANKRIAKRLFNTYIIKYYDGDRINYEDRLPKSLKSYIFLIENSVEHPKNVYDSGIMRVVCASKMKQKYFQEAHLPSLMMIKQLVSA